jgi:hypothetical protein
MAELDLSRCRPLGKGQWADKALVDRELSGLLGAYKRRIAGSYRAMREDEIPSSAGGWVSTKIDGELWFLVLGDGVPFLANPYGALIVGDIPVLQEAAILNLKGLLVIAGELHAKTEGRRCRVGDLAAALGGAEKAQTDLVCFAAFDVVQTGTTGVLAPYADRIEQLTQLITTSEHLWVVETTEIKNSTELQARYTTDVASSQAEGLVVRSSDGMVYKLKPSHTIDAVVLGYTVKTEAPDMLRSILLGLVREDGQFQVWGSCGNLGSDDDRKTLLTRLSVLKAESRYRYASNSGGLYTFVAPDVVIELRVTDLQAEKSDGTAIQSMQLDWDGTTWAPTRMASTASPIHPVFVRIRDDKQANAVDARIAQIGDWLETGTTSTSKCTPADIPLSTLLRREVWTKETKGKIAVRKLAVWKTNKETADSAFPAYVVHWTDYSAGRGTPLDREVRLAMEEGIAMQLADKMIADNIKKGWEKLP